MLHIPTVPLPVEQKTKKGGVSLAKANQNQDEAYSKLPDKFDSTDYGGAPSSAEESTPMVIKEAESARDEDDEDQFGDTTKKVP